VLQRHELTQLDAQYDEFENDYQYALVTEVGESFEDNVLFRQLKSIKQKFRSRGGFTIKTLKCRLTSKQTF
jgi:hypothetical protein